MLAVKVASSGDLSPTELDAAAEAHAKYAAYECLLLCSGVAHDPVKEQRRHQVIDERLRPRLMLTKREHAWLAEKLRSVPLPADTAAIASGGHRAALYQKVSTAPKSDAYAAAFLERQQTLVRVAGVAAAALPMPTRSAPSVSDAEARPAVFEGWLDMQPHKTGGAFTGRRADTWVARYFSLSAEGKLTWTPDAPASVTPGADASVAATPRMRTAYLTDRVVASLASDGALHMSGGPLRAALVLRPCAGDARGLEYLRQWQHAIDAHKPREDAGGRRGRRGSLFNMGRSSAGSRSAASSVASSSGALPPMVDMRVDAADIEATPWPPRFAFAMYCELVRAAAFRTDDADFDGDEWLPEEEANKAEALTLLRNVWAPLRISEHAHAAAVLQVTANLYKAATPNTEPCDALLDALSRAVAAALAAQAKHAAYTSTARRKVDAVREAAARLRAVGRRGKRRHVVDPNHPQNEPDGEHESRSLMSSTGLVQLDEQRASVAAALIQRTVVNSILAPETAHGEPAAVSWWVSERLTAIVAAAASNIADRLGDYRILDDERELPKMVHIWHALTLAAVVLRHDPTSLSQLVSEGVGGLRIEKDVTRLTPRAVVGVRLLGAAGPSAPALGPPPLPWALSPCLVPSPLPCALSPCLARAVAARCWAAASTLTPTLTPPPRLISRRQLLRAEAELEHRASNMIRTSVSAHVQRLRIRLQLRASDLKGHLLMHPEDEARAGGAGEPDRVLLQGWMLVRNHVGSFDHATANGEGGNDADGLGGGGRRPRARRGSLTRGQAQAHAHGALFDFLGGAASRLGGNGGNQAGWRRRYVRVRRGRITCHDSGNGSATGDDGSPFTLTILSSARPPPSRRDMDTLVVHAEHGNLEMRVITDEKATKHGVGAMLAFADGATSLLPFRRRSSADGGMSTAAVAASAATHSHNHGHHAHTKCHDDGENDGDCHSCTSLEVLFGAVSEAQRASSMAFESESIQEGAARALCEICPAVAEEVLVEADFVKAFGMCFREGARHALAIATLATQHAALEETDYLMRVLELPNDSAWAYSTLVNIGRLRSRLLSLMDAADFASLLGPTLAEQRQTGRRRIARIAKACALVVNVRDDLRVDEREAALPPPEALAELVNHVLHGLNKGFTNELEASLPRLLAAETWTPIDANARVTASAVDLLQQIHQMVDLFRQVALLEGLPAAASAGAIRPFFKLVNEQVLGYCNLLRVQWSRGEDHLPGAADGNAAWCAKRDPTRGRPTQGGGTAGGAAAPPSGVASGRAGIKTGFLIKQPLKGNMFSQERRRFFVLTESALQWFVSEGEKMKGELLLVPRPELDVLARVEMVGDRLEVHSQGERLVLRGDGLEAWREAIESVISSAADPAHAGAGGGAKSKPADKARRRSSVMKVVTSPLTGARSRMASTAGGGAGTGTGTGTGATSAGSAAVAPVAPIPKREPSTNTEDLAAVRVQAVWRGIKGRRTAPQRANALYLILNNTSWCAMKLALLERTSLGDLEARLNADGKPRLGGPGEGLPAGEISAVEISTIEEESAGPAERHVHTTSGQLARARTAFVAAGIELIRYIVRRGVYGRLPLRRAQSIGLTEFLREVSEGARQIAKTVLAPWRTPLLLTLLGTLVKALEMGQSEPARLAEIIVDEAPLDVLLLSDLPRLKDFMSEDGLHLDACIEAAVQDDEAAADADPAGIGALQRQAMRDLNGRARSYREQTRRKLTRGMTRNQLTRKLKETSQSADGLRAKTRARRGGATEHATTSRNVPTPKPAPNAENGLFARLPNMSQFVETVHLEHVQDQLRSARVHARSIAPSLDNVRGRWHGASAAANRGLAQCFPCIGGGGMADDTLHDHGEEAVGGDGSTNPFGGNDPPRSNPFGDEPAPPSTNPFEASKPKVMNPFEIEANAPTMARRSSLQDGLTVQNAQI